MMLIGEYPVIRFTIPASILPLGECLGKDWMDGHRVLRESALASTKSQWANLNSIPGLNAALKLGPIVTCTSEAGSGDHGSAHRKM
jgi:hypothetical protein